MGQWNRCRNVRAPHFGHRSELEGRASRPLTACGSSALVMALSLEVLNWDKESGALSGLTGEESELAADHSQGSGARIRPRLGPDQIAQK